MNLNVSPIRNPGMNPLLGCHLPGSEPESFTTAFKRSEPVPVRVTCDAHRWMSAYWMVLDHPFGAVTDWQGRFEIPDLPAGKHRIRVWHERAGWLERELVVELTPGGKNQLSLRYAAERFQ